MERLEGANVLIVSGGFAFTTLRSTIRYMLHEENRGKYGKITVIYGARDPGELLYKSELEEWKARDDMETHITIDREAPGWKGLVGFVPNVVAEVAPSSENTIALVCGPPIMLHFTFPRLLELGFPPDRIVTSLENKMKCGVGLCGRCNVGPKYVCCDGPVFTYEEIKALPQEF
jgi:NAD(P)H-flavin reductase